MSVTGVILAAGNSSRLGRAKQLLKFRGRPLIRHAAEVVIQSGVARVVVIVPAKAAEIVAALFGLDVAVIENAAAWEGIASSIRLGVEATPGPWLITLCDQPLVTEGHLRSLLQSGGPIAASRYPDGGAGVPALFGHSLRDELLALQGDRGARQIIESRPERVRFVDLGEASLDIDTEEDVARMGKEA